MFLNPIFSLISLIIFFECVIISTFDRVFNIFQIFLLMMFLFNIGLPIFVLFDLFEYPAGNRMLFGGNLLRQPAFIELQKSTPDAYRVAVETIGSDEIMNNTLFLGTYPGLTKPMLDFEIESINNFILDRSS